MKFISLVTFIVFSSFIGWADSPCNAMSEDLANQAVAYIKQSRDTNGDKALKVLPRPDEDTNLGGFSTRGLPARDVDALVGPSGINTYLSANANYTSSNTFGVFVCWEQPPPKESHSIGGFSVGGACIGEYIDLTEFAVRLPNSDEPNEWQKLSDLVGCDAN